MEPFIPSIVVQVDGPASGPPESITYAIVPVDQSRWRFRFTGLSPVTRGAVDADIVAANVGDPCQVVLTPDGPELHLVEGTPFELCSLGSGGQGGIGIVERALQRVQGVLR